MNLQRIVDKELDAGRSPDPHQMARSALLRIPPQHREEALLVALATYVEARVYERMDDPMPASTVASADSLRTDEPG